MIVSIQEYADLCGITYAGIVKRIEKGEILSKPGKDIGYSGYVIDTDKYPPIKAKKPGRKSISDVRVEK